MRLNTDEIEVGFNQELHNCLVKIFKYKGKKKAKIETVIEVGTYLGQGTTRIVADAIIEAKRQDDVCFYTIEADYEKFKVAKQNLIPYSSFVQPLHALALNLEECLEFISNDEAILNHENYPDLIIDHPSPVWFYRTETWSPFTNTEKQPQQGILYDLIPQHKENNPLIVEDGCGGTGWYEFQKVMELMEDNHYYLFCDDKGHLKSFRTYAHLKENPKQWKILFETDRLFVGEFMGK